jgi:hypothetical protein
METLIFAAHPDRGSSGKSEAIWAESIRTFAGKYQHAPIWIFYPRGEEEWADRLGKMTLPFKVDLHPFDIPAEARHLEYFEKCYASAAAEDLVDGKATHLVWMDASSLVVNPPEALLLPPEVYIGCRPVDLTNIGSRIADPPDDFWLLIYALCRVPPDRLFPMQPSTEAITIRPYFNAGLLVTRPGLRLLNAWRENLELARRNADILNMIRADEMRSIFLHQAVLAATILSRYTREQILIYPPQVNYALHLHQHYPGATRAKSLNELITCRSEYMQTEHGWLERMPEMLEPLKSWITARWES